MKGEESTCISIHFFKKNPFTQYCTQRATHGEFTLETDELRDTVPRVCLTKLDMQETKQKKEETKSEGEKNRK